MQADLQLLVIWAVTFDLTLHFQVFCLFDRDLNRRFSNIVQCVPILFLQHFIY